MPYLIDGHNLIAKIPEIRLGDIDDEIQLIKQLQAFCRRRGVKAVVYFDNASPGSSHTQKHGPVSAYFIRRGKTADDAMIAYLRKIGRAARNWIVITSDRAVAVASLEAGAEVISSEEFYRRFLLTEETEGMTPETDPNLNLTPESIEEWLKLFQKKDKRT